MLCEICEKREAENTHHLLFGRSIRRIADKDGITIKVCRSCHNMATKPEDRIHENPVAEKLSKDARSGSLGEGPYREVQSKC